MSLHVACLLTDKSATCAAGLTARQATTVSRVLVGMHRHNKIGKESGLKKTLLPAESETWLLVCS